VAACGGSGDQVERGIVVDVVVGGDVTSIERFVLLTADGERLELEPAPDVRFHDGAPLSHLTEHLRNSDPIEVRYRQLEDGTLAVVRVEDVSD
jgi:hypothetical protein